MDRDQAGPKEGCSPPPAHGLLSWTARPCELLAKLLKGARDVLGGPWGRGLLGHGRGKAVGRENGEHPSGP